MPVSPLVVFARDGWRCQICGRLTRQTAKVPDADAPTLDHVIPMVLGGPHTYANVQCAHFACNTAKGGRYTLRGEQLRLVG